MCMSLYRMTTGIIMVWYYTILREIETKPEKSNYM